MCLVYIPGHSKTFCLCSLKYSTDLRLEIWLCFMKTCKRKLLKAVYLLYMRLFEQYNWHPDEFVAIRVHYLVVCKSLVLSVETLALCGILHCTLILWLLMADNLKKRDFLGSRKSFFGRLSHAKSVKSKHEWVMSLIKKHYRLTWCKGIVYLGFVSFIYAGKEVYGMVIYKRANVRFMVEFIFIFRALHSKA